MASSCRRTSMRKCVIFPLRGGELADQRASDELGLKIQRWTAATLFRRYGHGSASAAVGNTAEFIITSVTEIMTRFAMRDRLRGLITAEWACE